MEIGLKERLVGAIVLVAVGVIVIPMILKGPGKPARTETVALPSPVSAARPQTYRLPLTNNHKPTTGTPSSTAAASPSGPEATKATTPEQTSSPIASPKAQTAPATATPVKSKPRAPATSTKPKPKATAAPTANGDAWVVQAGSFSEAGNAEKLLKSLKAKGFKAYLTTFTAGSRTYYRVRVGPFPDRAAAEKAAPAVAKATGGKADVLPAS